MKIQDLISRVKGMSASELEKLIYDAQRFSAFSPKEQQQIFAAFSARAPRRSIEVTLSGAASLDLWKNVTLWPNLFQEDRDYACGLLTTLDAKPDGPYRDLFRAILNAGIDHDLQTITAALMQRAGDGTQLSWDQKVAMRTLATQQPQAALELALKAASPAGQRSQALFVIGEELARTQEDYGAGLNEGLSAADRAVLDAGRAAGLLREVKPDGLALAKSLPDVELASLVQTQPAIMGLAKLEPPVAMQVLSLAEANNEALTQPLQIAAYTIAVRSPDLVGDWVQQQPPSAKRTAVTEGLVKTLEETKAPDAAEWRQTLDADKSPGGR